MLTIIFGLPGVGKTSLNTFFLKQAYFQEGEKLLSETNERIEKFNLKRESPLSLLEKPPIFANYNVKFLVDYEEEFEPYMVNPYYLGLSNERIETQFLPPNSKIHIAEAQKYYDSRESTTFPSHVSRFFEQHRHFKYDIYLDTQRPKLIDKNIRELAGRFLVVLKSVHERDQRGNIIATDFRCGEFDNWQSVEAYLNNGEKTYKDVPFHNRGCIFKCYNSFSSSDEFIPPQGKDFNLLPFLSANEVRNLQKINPGSAAFYNTQEPLEYRGRKKKEDKT